MRFSVDCGCYVTTARKSGHSSLIPLEKVGQIHTTRFEIDYFEACDHNLEVMSR